MIKRTMFAAIAAALAFAALPALAAANPHIDKSSVGFSFHSEQTITFTGTNNEGGTIELACHSTEPGSPSISGSGEFTSSETGNLQLTIHDCRGPLNVTCSSAGEPSGTITTEQLTFHLKTVEHEGASSPAILITPAGEEAYASFSCSFLANITVKGNGLVGTIESGYQESNEAQIAFEKASSNPHTQTHRFVTDSEEEYGLRAKLNSGSYQPTSLDATGTITFDETVTLTE